MFTPKKPEPGSSPALVNLARILLTVAMLVLVLMIGLAYRNWSLYNSARAAGLRVLEVQNSLEALISDLLDAESGRRGFLLTGEARYLEPCNRVIEAAPAELARLDKLVESQNSEEKANISRLKSLVNEKLTELRETLDLRKAQHAAPAIDVVLSDRGKEAMDEIRNICFDIRRQIASDRTTFQAQTRAATRGSFAIATAGSLFLIALLVTGYLLIGKRTRDREQALAGIRELSEFGTRILLAKDLCSLLGETLSTAERITGADMGNIQLLDSSGALRIEAQNGFPAEFLDFFNAVHHGDPACCATALGRREQVIVENIKRSPIFIGTPALGVLLRAGVHALQSTPLISRSGNVVGVLSTHYRRPRRPSDPDLRLLAVLGRQAADLIEKFRADEALRVSEEDHRATFENVAVGIADVGLDGRWLRFNEALCQITGYSHDELLGKTVADITHPDDIESSWVRLQQLAAGEMPTCSMEKRYIRNDGSTVWVNLTASVLREPSGAPKHYVKVLEDITQRKLAERELQTARDQLQLVADNMAAAVSRCSRDRRYIWVSRRYAEWLHRAPADIIGRPIAVVIGAQGYEGVRPYIDRVLSGERVEYTAEVNLLGAGQRWVSAVYVPTWDENQQVDGWIAVVTDVTEERHAAEQLRQSQRLESVGMLAGGIAHDFNNLLVGVLGNASLALDVLGPATPARQMLESLIASAERAAALTRQLLAYAGKERLVTQPVNVSDVIEEVGALLRTSIPANVRFELRLPSFLPRIEADQTQLHQVVMNLVLNATEAIPESTTGTVVVTAESRTLSAWDYEHSIVPLPRNGHSYLAVTVSDTGEGMSPEVQTRIFEPFFTTKFTGRGLGLSAVLGILTAHHGGITLRTAPGRGTMMTLLFPAAQSAAPAELQPRVQTAPGSGVVLVIDDEPGVREIVRKTLEHHGYQVLLAENGEEGIEVFDAHPEVIAIVLDVAMPIMSGDRAAPELRKINPSIPIIVSSGYPEGEVRRRFVGVGATAFLPKPYNAARLLETLSASLVASDEARQVALSPSNT